MKDQRLPLRDKASLALLSFFGSGYFPFMPGTIGSLATIPLILLLNYLSIGFYTLVMFIIMLTIISCVEAHYIQEKRNVQDPGWIVIDEVIGMLITWLFVYPACDLTSLTAVFLIFRFFDIVKIYPANWVDKKIKNGAGTILDDVVSGIYSGLILLCLNYFNLLI